jgi:WD40 repeat protein
LCRTIKETEEKASGGNMKKKYFFHPGHLLAVPVLIILGACATAEILPAETLTQESSIEKTPSLEKESPTETRTRTITNEPTMTVTQSEYRLVDWKEPTEVIGPENMDRVEKVGEIQFSDVINKFAWSPDGSKFGASSKGKVYVMDSRTFSNQMKAEGSFVVFSYDGKILETEQYRYYLETGEKLQTGYLNQYPGGVLDYEFSPNGEYIASAGTQYIQIYSIKEGITLAAFGRYVWATWHISVSLDSKLVAVNSYEETFTELWDPFQQKPIRILKLKGITSQGKPRFTKDGTRLFITGDGTFQGKEASYLQEWDYRTGKPFSVQILPEIVMYQDSPIDISPLTSVAAYGTREGRVFLLPVRNCRTIKIGEIDQSKSPIDMVAFRPDGKLIATTGFSDNIIELYGIPSSTSNTPTVEIAETPTACPEIPIEVEHPTPQNDWWGGDKPHL